MTFFEEIDWKFNLDLRSGYVRCHGSGDLVATSNGDIAATSTYDEYLLQRLVLWLAIPKGEVPGDPRCGCVMHDFLHEKKTKNSLFTLAKELEYDVQYAFPELGVIRVECYDKGDFVQIVFHTFNRTVDLLLNRIEFLDVMDDVIDMFSVGMPP